MIHDNDMRIAHIMVVDTVGETLVRVLELLRDRCDKMMVSSAISFRVQQFRN
jgi:hypothetical protein